MEDTIRVALARWRDRQPNMASEAFRNGLADEIAILLKENGSYKEYTEYELDEQKARASWICSICGENTFEVDSDYIGTGTNHLGCEMKNWKEIKDHINDGHREPPYNSFVRNKEESEKSNDYVYSKDMKEGMERARELAQEGLEEGLKSNKKERGPDRRSGDRREKNYSQEKHEDKVFGHDQGGSYKIPTTDDDGRDLNFIYGAEEVDGMYFEDEVREWEEAVGYVEPDNDTDVELRDKVFEEQKHEFYENTQKQLYNEMTSDGLPEGGDAQAVKESHRLAEELVDSPLGYIYESPDGGKTIYQRKVGETKRTKLTKKEWKNIKNEKK
jgi:hypothetical protein